VYPLFDVEGVLLYAGISADPRQRFHNHRYGSGRRSKPKEWWPQVASARLERFDSRLRADTAESFAVVTEHPRHNNAKTGETFACWFKHRWLEERLAGGPYGHVGGWVCARTVGSVLQSVETTLACASASCAARASAWWAVGRVRAITVPRPGRW
jgi:hypothetical protein